MTDLTPSAGTCITRVVGALTGSYLDSQKIRVSSTTDVSGRDYLLDT